MQFIDDAEFQIAIDDDNGARIVSLKWRDNEFAVPFRGQVHTSGWYAMAPWAGRINEGLITNSKGESFQLPATIDPPHAKYYDLFYPGYLQVCASGLRNLFECR